jgi:hypothetical protein
MSRMKKESRGRRPRFFPSAGADETVSILLELAAEIWTVKERLYVVEKAAADAGLDLSERVESWRPSEAESAELDAQRQRMLKTLFRSLDASYVTGAHLRDEMDAAAAQDKDLAETLYAPDRAA